MTILALFAAIFFYQLESDRTASGADPFPLLVKYPFLLHHLLFAFAAIHYPEGLIGNLNLENPLFHRHHDTGHFTRIDHRPYRRFFPVRLDG